MSCQKIATFLNAIAYEKNSFYSAVIISQTLSVYHSITAIGRSDLLEEMLWKQPMW